MPVKQTNTPLRAKLLEATKSLSNKKCEVGYFGGTHSGSGMSYPQLMWLQEVHGVRSSNGRTHRRLFEMTAIRHQQEILKNLQNSVKNNLLNNPESILKDFGEDLKNRLIQGFGDSSFLPSNTLATQHAKGGRNTPLVDTGELRDNLKYRITKKR